MSEDARARPTTSRVASSSEDEPNAASGEGSALSRRKILSAVGGTGIGSLAGCGGGGGSSAGGGGGGSDDSSGNEENTEGTTKHYNRRFENTTFTNPKQLQWNPYNPTGNRIGPMVYHKFMRFNEHPDVKGFVSRILKDWNVSGKTASLTLHDNFTWHDGKPVTAEDVVTKLKIEKLYNAAVDDYAASVSQDGKYTVKIDLKSRTSPTVFNWTLVNLPFDTPTQTYGKFAEMYDDATSKEEQKNARAKLTQFKLKDKPIGNGLGKLGKVSVDAAEFDVWEEHPEAKNVNYDGWVYKYHPTNQKSWQALKAKELDGFAHFMSPSVLRSVRDSVDIYLRSNWVGESLDVNHRREPFNNRKFRQAMAHVIDSKAVAQAVGGAPIKEADGRRIKSPRKYFHGTSKAIHEEYLAEIEDQFTTYGQNDTEKAASLLKEAGFSKEDGTWIRPNGKPVEFSIKIDSCCNDWVDGARAAAGQLSQFGFKAKFSTMEGAALWSDFEAGNFDVIGANWGTYGKRAAYFDFHNEFGPSQRPSNTGYDPTKIQIDQSLPNRDGGTINANKIKSELAQTTDPKKSKELIQDLAMIFNIDQPQIMLMEKLSPAFMNDAEWKYPSRDSKPLGVKWPDEWLPNNGLLQAESKS